MSILVPCLAHADPKRNDGGSFHASATTSEVIGGHDAAAGAWPDVAAILDASGQQFCSGTLVAPNVVLTAGHCHDPMLKSVLVGTTSLAKPGDGQTIAVTKQVEYPNSQTSIDVTVLVLASNATMAPRKIATGWASLDIKNGASISIVGYGAVDRMGPVPISGNGQEQYINELQEATTTITDADCTLNKTNGCNAAAAPNGELGAGGMGIDTCPGDSGGPLYLPTDYGTFLAGVTSRSYDNAQFYCSEGGIYARPDKIVDWIEQASGAKVARGPEPTYAPLMAIRGNAAETMIDANDPKSTKHTYAITTPPAHGTAKIRDDGAVRVCTDPGVAGDDSIVVAITDSTASGRVLSIKMPITIADGTPGASCDVNAFGTDDGGGCCDSGRSAGGALPLSILVLALLRRRR